MAEETKKKERKEEKSLEKMTVKELRAIAIEMPRSFAIQDMKKEELIAFIKEARGVSDQEPVRAKKKIVKKIKLTKSEMKRNIKKLKDEKKESQATNNRKKSDLLRRRISHLKKQTRRFASA